MSVKEIHILPDPVLRQKAKRIRIIDGSTKKLVDNMLDTMHDASGAGLAAPQIGVSLRVVVIGMPDEEDIVLINPEIVKKSGERTITEGCLSIPGYFAKINRAEHVTAKGRDLKGKEKRIKADGLLAQALEHEIDHLNGVLYIDHLDNMDELQKVEPEDADD